MQLSPEDIAYLRTQHLAILAPMYGGQCYAPYVAGLLNFTQAAMQIGLRVSFLPLINESLIPRGRNTLVAQAMNTPQITKMMFIDSDLSFSADHILRLLLAKKDVIGGLYPKKCLPPDFVVNVAPEQLDSEGKLKMDENNLLEVTRLGTGFLMFDRSVIERLMIAFPDKQFNNNIGMPPEFNKFMYVFFDCWITPDSSREYLSEDWAFCQLVRSIGIKVWADTAVRCDHTGTFTYPCYPENLYKQMGLSMNDQPQLIPRITPRPDEMSADGKIHLPVQPNLEAVDKWNQARAFKDSNAFGNISL